MRRARILDDLPRMILRCARLWRPDAVPGAAAAEPLRSAKVGRNDPCPCGSGKKFKRCCGAGGGSPPPIGPAASAVSTGLAETGPRTGYAVGWAAEVELT